MYTMRNKIPVISSCYLLLTLSYPLVSTEEQRAGENKIPNIVVILIDDLGWNQVGYHANPEGNDEIQTPNIDYYSKHGVEMDRGYMTPWCAPSRAAIQTGRSNSYNGNVSSTYAFDEDIGFISGLQAGTKTIATAFKEYAEDQGQQAKAYYNGKWGIGGSAWVNTPMGMGYDYVRGFWGNSIESCDGYIPSTVNPPYTGPYGSSPDDPEFGPLLANVLPGYFDQNPLYPDSDICPYIQSLPEELLSEEEKYVACKTHPRTPAKLIDQDVVDSVVDQIHHHDYDAGPMLQFFATQMVHDPLQYPKEYDIINNATGMVPTYFLDSEEKPIPGNDDTRIATANAVRFMDDLVGTTMQAIRDAGQWDNTIVYFSSDNGGPVYLGAANNNYPLRSSKFSKFEGGLRVPQFISGGWIDWHLPADRKSQSDTYIFPMDVGPTLLQMAGATVDYLLENKTGAVYGHRMWNYIRNSVQKVFPNQQDEVVTNDSNNSTTTTDTDYETTYASSSSPHQKERTVSYSYDLYFDVTEETTIKNFYTGNIPQTMPRLWSPKYPQKDDLMMDNGYVSVYPCRPDGKEKECCSFDLNNDIQESHPRDVNCNKLQRKAQDLFTIEGGCLPEDEVQTNPICIPPNAPYFTADHYPEAYKLWTFYGAAGPFLNASGTPVNTSLPMVCVCNSIADGTSQSDVDYYTLTVFSPPTCYSSTNEQGVTPLSVKCNGGGFNTVPQGGVLDSYKAQGFNPNLFEDLNDAEANREFTTAKSYLLPQNAQIYLTRKGFTEWPNLARFPFNAFGLDTCAKKRAVPVPWPELNLAPYAFGNLSPTNPVNSETGLCASFDSERFFCPAKQNANMTPVESWSFDRDDPFGVFVDGRDWPHLTPEECNQTCLWNGDGSAYIGNGTWGILVDKNYPF